MQLAADVLLKKDLIYLRDDEYYCVLDPAMKYYLDIILWKCALN